MSERDVDAVIERVAVSVWSAHDVGLSSIVRNTLSALRPGDRLPNGLVAVKGTGE